MSKLIYFVLGIVILVFIWISLDFDFFQDDAYISFRYVANYLNGDGLVFNSGERIEGYTNFGWILFMLLGGVLSLGYMGLAKYTGILLGGSSIIITYKICSRLIDKDGKLFGLLSAILVGINFSLAYWSQAGLETAAFVFITTLSFYLFIIRHPLLIAALTYAVLIRPEGALVAALFVITEALTTRRLPLYSLICSVAAFLFSLPYIGFKLLYFGSLLPNPFYAKTNFNISQLESGIEYAARFFSHYPYVALGLLVTPLFWRKLKEEMKVTWLFTILYALYIIFIGGDVLKVHRFFLPIIPSATILFALSLHLSFYSLKSKNRYLVIFIFVLLGLVSNFFLPRDFISHYKRAEKALTHKLGYLARQMAKTDKRDFTVAASTIGIFGYELIGHRVIDLLGLTDSTVAKHPEPPISGLESSWKEAKYNSIYILEQSPDYILFSTGTKPSAPAERALMLYPQFVHGYGGASWHYLPPGRKVGGEIPIFRKMHPYSPPYLPILSPEFANTYNKGINSYNAGDYKTAKECFELTMGLAGDKPHLYSMYKLSLTLYRLKQYDEGYRLQNEILALDSTMYEVQADMYVYEITLGNREKAIIHREWLKKLVPWKLARYDSLAVSRISLYKSQQDQISQTR